MKKYLSILILLIALLFTENIYAWSTYTNYARIVNLTRNRTPITVRVEMGGDTQYIESESYEYDDTTRHNNSLPNNPSTISIPWGTSVVLQWQSQLTVGLFDNTIYVQQLDITYTDNSSAKTHDTLWIRGKDGADQQTIHASDECWHFNSYKLTDSAAGTYVDPLYLICAKEGDKREDTTKSHIGFFGGWQTPTQSRMTIVFKGDNT